MLKKRFKNLHMDRPQQSEPAKSTAVLSIECLSGGSKADEWTGDMLQTGDIVEEIRIGSGSGSAQYKAPFKGGKSGVQKVLHSSFKNKETSIVVRVRRVGGEFTSLQACIVPNSEAVAKRQYMLRSIDDPNYAVGFSDRFESDCLELQASRSSRLVNALSEAKLHEGFVSYPWEQKMHAVLNVAKSSCFLSIIFFPKTSDPVASRYNDLEDTLARANAWLSASQLSGVPIVFINIQTEPLLTKLCGETASSAVNASSLTDLSNLANASLYGFEDYHGIDIGVVRAVRLWFEPLGSEYAVEILLKKEDSKLGFTISRTEEGFIYISSVIDDDENAPSTRSGLSNLYKEALKASRLLVISRVSNQKVLPWMVSSTGAVRCYDTVSLSQKLSLHRHANVPILFHVFLWDQNVIPTSSGASSRFRASVVPMELPQEVRLPPELLLIRQPSENQVLPQDDSDDLEFNLERDTVDGEFTLQRANIGDISFRFNDLSFSNRA